MSSSSISHCAPIDSTWQQTQYRLIRWPRARPASLSSLFLHERRTPAGRPRLVALACSPAFGPHGVAICADLRLFTPGTLLSPHFPELTVKKNPQLPTSGTIPNFPGAPLFLGYVPWGSDFRLYPAQPDPAYPTAFTLPYTLNNSHGSLTFHLTDDDSATVTTPDGQPLPHSFHPLPTTQP